MTEDTAFGVVEVFHAGAWGSFCDGDTFRFDYTSLTPPIPFNSVRFCEATWPQFAPVSSDSDRCLHIAGVVMWRSTLITPTAVFITLLR